MANDDKIDNPPAFPNSLGRDGMTLRDYFAGQALIPVCQAVRGIEPAVPASEVARYAYGMADAMLRARLKDGEV